MGPNFDGIEGIAFLTRYVFIDGFFRSRFKEMKLDCFDDGKYTLYKLLFLKL